jgi:hypothetical protein
MDNLRYVQFQPDADLLDVRFQMMTPGERGVYWTIKLYLYANSGKCPFDEAMLSKVTGCENFGEIWEKIKINFVIKDSTIRHKTISKDLRKAKKFLQGQRRAGIKGAKKRWGSYSEPNSKTIAKLSKVKLSKVKLSKEEESALAKFQKPSAQDVSEYAEGIGFGQLNSQQFVDFYEAKGWMVGRNKMRDWRAAVRTWKARSQKEGQYDKCQRAPGRTSRQRNYKHKPMPGEAVLTD